MKQKTPSGGKASKRGTKALSDRVHKHLSDKNDIITDEDIKNIKVGEDGVEEDIKDAEKMTKALEQKKATSSWSILTEEDK
jgi:hypothetical protein